MGRERWCGKRMTVRPFGWWKALTLVVWVAAVLPAIGWGSATVGRGGLKSAGGAGMGQELPGWYTCEVSVAPAMPTMQDPVEVTAGGWWLHIPAPVFERCATMGSVIEMHFVYDPPQVVLPVVVLWGETVGVGKLPPGSYEVGAYINEISCASGSFGVYEEVWQTYLPAVARQE